ncbi:hypothetical protein PHOSAC3_150113 [Mesotoga infera]|nr:hypothetical protein PHOSAC3_150113 [Mesotoga infera]
MVWVSGLVVGKSKDTGWPLSGSPFAEKNREARALRFRPGALSE